MHPLLRLPAGLAMVLLAGCAVFTEYGRYTSDARRSFGQGHLEEAALLSVKALRLKPDYADAQLILCQAFPTARRRHLDAIETLKARSAHFADDQTVTQREQIVREYEALILLTQEASSLPPFTIAATGDVIAFPYEDYNTLLAEASGSLQDARQAAAAMHYQRGVELRRLPGREPARLAAAAFSRALDYAPNYRDAQVQYAAAREAGTIRVAVVAFDTSSVWPHQRLLDDRLPDLVANALLRHANDLEFTRLVPRADLVRLARDRRLSLTRATASTQDAVDLGKALGVDQLIVGRVSKLSLPPVATARESWQDSAQVSLGYQTVVGPDGKLYQQEVTGVVSAQVTRHTRRAAAQLAADWQLVDVAAASTTAAGTREAESEWSTEWGTWNGDQRALSDRSRQLLQRTETNYPGDRSLLDQALAKLVAQLDEALLVHLQ